MRAIYALISLFLVCCLVRILSLSHFPDHSSLLVEFQEIFIINLKVSECLEDLLKSSLRSRVFANLVLLFLVFNQTENETYRLLSSWYSHLVVVIVVLQDFNLAEIIAETIDNLHASLFHINPLKKIVSFHKTLMLICFQAEIITETIISQLTDEEWIN